MRNYKVRTLEMPRFWFGGGVCGLIWLLGRDPMYLFIVIPLMMATIYLSRPVITVVLGEDSISITEYQRDFLFSEIRSVRAILPPTSSRSTQIQFGREKIVFSADRENHQDLDDLTAELIRRAKSLNERRSDKVISIHTQY